MTQTLTITHTTADGTLLDGSRKGDGVWDILRAKGWRFGRSVGIYVPHSRDRAPKHHLISSSADALRAAGFDVTVDIADAAPRPMGESEADRAARSDARTERLTEKATKLEREADTRHNAAMAIVEQIPPGQPILVDHYSAPRHRRALERHDGHMRAAINAGEEAKRAADAAASSAVHMAARENPVTTANRIKKLEAELRDIARKLTPCELSGRTMKPEAAGQTITCPACYRGHTVGGDLVFPEHGNARGAWAAQLIERRTFINNELPHWRGVLDVARAEGRFGVVDWDQVKRGDMVTGRHGADMVDKVNKVTLTVVVAPGWNNKADKVRVTGHVSIVDHKPTTPLTADEQQEARELAAEHDEKWLRSEVVAEYRRVLDRHTTDTAPHARRVDILAAALRHLLAPVEPTPLDVDDTEQEEAPTDESTPDEEDGELAPGMYRVRITVTNRDGVHTATEDMNPAAIELAQARPGWSVEILGESRVTIVEDDAAELDALSQQVDGDPATLTGEEITRRLRLYRQLIAMHPSPWVDGGEEADRVALLRRRLARLTGEEARRAAVARVETNPRAVTGTPENIAARTSARARGERAAQLGLTFDVADRQAMTGAQLRATAGDALALF